MKICVGILASQLIDFPYGDGIEVAMGGGRRNFMTQSARDPETGAKGKRQDGRDLISEWTRKTKGKWTYVWNDTQFQQLDINSVDHVLGMNFFVLIGWGKISLLVKFIQRSSFYDFMFLVLG